MLRVEPAARALLGHRGDWKAGMFRAGSAHSHEAPEMIRLIRLLFGMRQVIGPECAVAVVREEREVAAGGAGCMSESVCEYAIRTNALQRGGNVNVRVRCVDGHVVGAVLVAYGPLGLLWRATGPTKPTPSHAPCTAPVRKVAKVVRRLARRSAVYTSSLGCSRRTPSPRRGRWHRTPCRRTIRQRVGRSTNRSIQ